MRLNKVIQELEQSVHTVTFPQGNSTSFEIFHTKMREAIRANLDQTPDNVVFRREEYGDPATFEVQYEIVVCLNDELAGIPVISGTVSHWIDPMQPLGPQFEKINKAMRKLNEWNAAILHGRRGK